MDLPNFTKKRIATKVVDSIKQIENKSIFYTREDEGLNALIAKKSNIDIIKYGGEAGRVNIDEYIELTRDELEIKEYNKINKIQPRRPNHKIKIYPEFNVSEELKQLTKEFEEQNIPKSGPCKTQIGEMFRAIQRIQYRVFNDGDLWFTVDSPTFMSYIFLVSQIDELNWSSQSWDEETGQHYFKFTDVFLIDNSWDGKISTMIEHSLAEDAEFIKYQLMDLLSNGKITDDKNIYDSRDYSLLNKEYSY